MMKNNIFLIKIKEKKMDNKKLKIIENIINKSLNFKRDNDNGFLLNDDDIIMGALQAINQDFNDEIYNIIEDKLKDIRISRKNNS